MKKENYFIKILGILKDLNHKYPNYDVARHISDATYDYDNIWGLSDKELYYCLEAYKTSLELDYPTDDVIDKIINDGLNLSLDTEEE